MAVGCEQAENSDVLPTPSVAVDVMRCPEGTVTFNVTLKLALPDPSVVTLVEPR